MAERMIHIQPPVGVFAGTPWQLQEWFLNRYFPMWKEDVSGNPDHAAINSFVSWLNRRPDHQNSVNVELNYRLECRRDFMAGMDFNRITGFFGKQGSGKSKSCLGMCVLRHEEKLNAGVYDKLGAVREELQWTPIEHIFNSVGDAMDALPYFHPGFIAMIDDPIAHSNNVLKTIFLSDLGRLRKALDKLRELYYDFYITAVDPGMFPLEAIFELNEVRLKSPEQQCAHVINYRKVSAFDQHYECYGFYTIPHPSKLINSELCGMTQEEFLIIADKIKKDLMAHADETKHDIREYRDFLALLATPDDFLVASRTSKERTNYITLHPHFRQMHPHYVGRIEALWHGLLDKFGCVIREGKGQGRTDSSRLKVELPNMVRFIEGEVEKNRPEYLKKKKAPHPTNASMRESAPPLPP